MEKEFLENWTMGFILHIENAHHTFNSESDLEGVFTLTSFTSVFCVLLIAIACGDISI